MQYSEIIYKLFKGDDVWIEFNNPKEARRGSIGRVRPNPIVGQRRIDIEKELAYTSYSFYSAKLWEMYPCLVVEFPGCNAKDIILPQSYDFRKIKVLHGYQGKAVRMNTPVQRAKPGVFFDKFKNKASIGDFIAFVHKGELKFGTITLLGSEESKWLHFRDVDGVESYFVAYPNMFAIIDKDFRTRMMLRKLAKK